MAFYYCEGMCYTLDIKQHTLTKIWHVDYKWPDAKLTV
jgi:hypothetical protein